MYRRAFFYYLLILLFLAIQNIKSFLILMKTHYFLILLIISTHVFGQNKGPSSAPEIYSVVQQMLEFPGGEDSMWKFINTNVKYPDSAIAHNIEGKLIMGFVVNENGSISDITIRRGLSWDIDSEGMRVIRLFPSFTPGKQDGKAVKVSYTLPLSFKLKPNPLDTVKKPHIIEQMPAFPGGDTMLFKLVQRAIHYPEYARDHGIQGRVVVGFVVNEDGIVSDIKIKQSVYPSIDTEAIRIVKLLPRFKPGTQQGKPVRVSYVLPIRFKLINSDNGSIQSPPPLAWEDIPTKVEIMPEFPGGIKKLTEFLNTNVKYPGDALKLDIEGIAVVGFIVNEDGHLSDFGFVLKDYQSFNKEAMRVAKLLPVFKPGIKNGKPVKVLYKLPFNFRMDEPVIEKKVEPIKFDIR